MSLGRRLLNVILRFFVAVANIPIRLIFVLLALLLVFGGTYLHTQRSMYNNVGGKDEYDEAMEEIASDPRYKWILPGALATLLGGGYLALRYPGPYTKFASQTKQADELFRYGGYVPDINFHQIVNAGQAKDLFTNDPNLKNDPYVRNMGVAIINDAANRTGFVNPTLGNIYDSAANKIKNKLSWQGVANVAAKTMIANSTAHLLTSAIGAVVPLPKEVKRKIIDGGTWAAAAMSILT